MIQKAIDKFISNKDKLFNEKLPESYSDIFKSVIDLIKDEYDNDLNFDSNRITMIDHGDYQGNQLFIIACDDYQPSNYWWVDVSYGSCSGCDTFQNIIEKISFKDKDDEDYFETLEEVKKELRVLALHMVQKLKVLE